MQVFKSLFSIFLVFSFSILQAQNGVTPVAGNVIFNEYVADNNASGNDYFELLTLVDNLDLRGLRVSDNELVSGALNNGEAVFVFDSAAYLNNVPRGTIIAVWSSSTGVVTDTTTNPAVSDWTMILVPGTGVTISADGLGGTTNAGLSNGGEALYLYLPGGDGSSVGTDNIYLDFISFENDGGDAPAGLADINLPSVGDNAYFTGSSAITNDTITNWVKYDFTGTSSPNTTPGTANPGQNLNGLQITCVLPTVIVTITENSGIPNDGIICTGASATLTATGANTFWWNNGSTTAAITVNSIGTYSVIGILSAGCQDTTVVTINSGSTVNPMITATENSGNTPNDGILCAGGTAVLTATGASAYLWSNGSTTATINVSNAGLYSVSATDAAGCINSTSYNVVINQLPNATITVTPSTVILGATLNLAVANAGTGASYNWTGSGISNANANTTTANPLAVGTQPYGITITTANGCSATQTTSATVITPIEVNLLTSVNTGSEAGTTSITVTAQTTAAVVGNQTVTLSVSGSNITNNDYFLTGNTITIPNGQNSGSVTFVIADDATPEMQETAVLNISNPSAGLMLGNTVVQNITIVNNDCSFLTKVGGITSANGAEISAFDHGSNRLYTVAGSVVEYFTMDSLGALTLGGSLPFGFTVPSGVEVLPNSISIKNGVLAAAYAVRDAATLAQMLGKVSFYNAATGAFINEVTVGYLPDMVTFSPDGTKVLTANEGEPNSYGQSNSFDPEGSVSIINIANGVSMATVQNASFNAFDSQITSLKTAGVRIFGPNATVSQDLEPEYIAFSTDGLTAKITLQENNAIADLNIATATITGIYPLGRKNHSLPGNGFDASDRDLNGTLGKINIQNWPVSGLYMPDAIASFSNNGQTYYITANEGDSRAYTGFSEEVRVGASSYILDPTVFPNASTLKNNVNLGRLQLTNASGDTDADGDIDRIDAFGARSFSIWNSSGALVYDSGDQIEQITAVKAPSAFNSDGLPASFDTRSDNKGPEPEGVAVGMIDNNLYAFIGLERVGDIMVYNINDPSNPVFVQYVNLTEDQAIEGLLFVKADDSPTGNPLLVTTNEVSFTVAVFEIGVNAHIAIAETSGTTPNDGTFCNNDQVTLTVQGGRNYQWSNGLTSSAIMVNDGGVYTVSVTNSAGCIDVASATLIENTPSATIMANDDSGILNNDGIICQGDSVSLNVSNGVGYMWSDGSTGNTISVATAGNYTVTVTDSNACTATASQTVAVNVATLPSINLVDVSGINTNDGIICQGDSVSLNASNGVGYMWSDGSTSNVISVAAAGNYTVTVTDSNVCTATVSQTVAVNMVTLPSINLVDVSGTNTNDGIICQGDSVSLNVSNGVGYMWSDGSTSNVISVAAAGNYTVTVTDSNACTATTSQTVVVNAIPLVTVSIIENSGFANDDIVCSGDNAVISATGGVQYLWANGATTSSITAMAGGIYQLTVTNTDACSVVGAKTLIENSPLGHTAAISNVSCFGDNDGGINITVTGGTMPYSYTWSNGLHYQDLSGIVAGQYGVSISDARGCSYSPAGGFAVTQPLNLTTTLSATDVTTPGGNDGSISNTILGGTSPYTILWNDGINTQNRIDLTAGEYQVTVTDSKNCTAISSVVVGEPSGLTNASFLKNLSIYPNPTHGNIIVSFDISKPQNVKISAVNLLGQNVFQYNAFVSDHADLSLDLSSLVAGSYQLIFVLDEEVFSHRVLIMN